MAHKSSPIVELTRLGRPPLIAVVPDRRFSSQHSGRSSTSRPQGESLYSAGAFCHLPCCLVGRVRRRTFHILGIVRQRQN